MSLLCKFGDSDMSDYKSLALLRVAFSVKMTKMVNSGQVAC